MTLMLCVSQAKYESEITGLQKRLKDREAEMDETTNSHREAQVSLVSSTYIVIIIYYYCYAFIMCCIFGLNLLIGAS